MSTAKSFTPGQDQMQNKPASQIQGPLFQVCHLTLQEVHHLQESHLHIMALMARDRLIKLTVVRDLEHHKVKLILRMNNQETLLKEVGLERSQHQWVHNHRPVVVLYLTL